MFISFAVFFVSGVGIIIDAMALQDGPLRNTLGYVFLILLGVSLVAFVTLLIVLIVVNRQNIKDYFNKMKK